MFFGSTRRDTRAPRNVIPARGLSWACPRVHHRPGVDEQKAKKRRPQEETSTPEFGAVAKCCPKEHRECELGRRVTRSILRTRWGCIPSRAWWSERVSPHMGCLGPGRVVEGEACALTRGFGIDGPAVKCSEQEMRSASRFPSPAEVNLIHPVYAACEWSLAWSCGRTSHLCWGFGFALGVAFPLP